MTSLSGDNLTSLLIALIVAVTTVWTARFSKRRPGEDTRRQLNAYRVKLADCENTLSKEREAFFAEREFWERRREARRARKQKTP